ncbi:hypothetical protein L1887_59683 [Cichorium endivia]|nr:hypothetical protein L1887_59683 [Cichorium endivia]
MQPCSWAKSKALCPQPDGPKPHAMRNLGRGKRRKSEIYESHESARGSRWSLRGSPALGLEPTRSEPQPAPASPSRAIERAGQKAPGRAKPEEPLGSIIPAPNFLLFLAFHLSPISPISLIWPRPKTRRAALSEVIPPSIQPCADTERTETDMDASSRAEAKLRNATKETLARQVDVGGELQCASVSPPPPRGRARGPLQGTAGDARALQRTRGPGPNATRAAPTPRTPPEPKKEASGFFLFLSPSLSLLGAPGAASRAERSIRTNRAEAPPRPMPRCTMRRHSSSRPGQPKKKTLRDIQLRLYASCQVK